METRLAQAEILDYIRQSKERWRQQYGVVKVALFGSYARDEHLATSDIDILIEMDPTTFDGYMDLKFELEDHFKRSVDLVTKQAIKERMFPFIEPDLLYA
ncbi:nucleotidyltransferase family protein [bacterium]|nr:nucleotidyltransferase family protein [bacterium]